MTESETLRMIRDKYGAILISAAVHFGHRAEVLAGIMMRESAGGTSPLLDKPGPEGRGDGGHGHGLMQIDDRSYHDFCASEDWKDPAKNIDKSALVLRQKRAYLASALLGYGMDNDAMERAMIAAYNCGEGNVARAVRQGKDVDAFTAHGSYSREVLRFAEIYRALRPEDA